jgi:hypothetical protein
MSGDETVRVEKFKIERFMARNRRVCRPRPPPRLRHERFRRDPCRTVRVGPEATRCELRGRRQGSQLRPRTEAGDRSDRHPVVSRGDDRVRDDANAGCLVRGEARGGSPIATGAVRSSARATPFVLPAGFTEARLTSASICARLSVSREEALVRVVLRPSLLRRLRGAALSATSAPTHSYVRGTVSFERGGGCDASLSEDSQSPEWRAGDT